MWIMVSGPYRAPNADVQAENLRALNRAAVAIFRKGHLPVIGVNLALPMIDAAGADSYGGIMMPLCVRLIERCDAVLRIEGISEGADEEVAEFRARGLTVFHSIAEIPHAE